MGARSEAELEPSRVQIERRDAVTEVGVECRLTPEAKRASDYALVPFEVPPGTRRLELAYRYEGQQQLGSRNEIDLGLVDPRGAEFPVFPGFRGWSGNARIGAALTERGATPGYLPGPIEPGRWWVLLGLYKLDPEGVDLRLTIRLSPVEGESTFPPPRGGTGSRAGAPGPEDMRWRAGDLHSHTRHSDAAGTLDDLAGAARQRGLEFLAVTDHNTTSHFPYLGGADGLTLLPGEEVTTYYGHMNVWGNTTPMDFRAREASELRAIIDVAHDQGAVVSASHPTLDGMDWRFGYDLPLDCLEVWHGAAGPRNVAALDIWQELLAAGRRVVAVGGSDVHIGKPGSPVPGAPTTWLNVSSLSRANVLDALRAGRVTITSHEGPWLELDASRGSQHWGVGDIAPVGPMRIRCTVQRGEGHALRLLSAHGEFAALDVDCTPFVHEFEADLSALRLVRAELIQPETHGFRLSALTNPIWS